MGPDAIALLGLVLALLVLAGVALAARTTVPAPVILVAVGLAASFLPGAPETRLPPQLIFLVFLPPLVFRASFLTSPRQLRENATALALLSVGLVAATAFGIAAVVSALIPGVTFAEGLVLGAVVAPTDPVAASSVFARLGAPQRLVDLVEGESLINDATALVLYAIAVDAVVSGPPSPGSAVMTLLLSVGGGIGVGLAIGALVAFARRFVSDVGLQLLLSLITPFAAYIPAERIGGSGVLAVVTAGILLGSTRQGVFSPSARLQSGAFWSLLDLLLNAVLFVLLGLEIRQVIANAPNVGAAALAGYAALVVATVVVIRMVWQLVIPPLAYRVRVALGRDASPSSLPTRILLGWTGMRGAISLAAALALPLRAGARPFPDRSLLVFLTAAVVLVTLVVQGTSLPALLRRPFFDEQDDAEEEEIATRLALAEVALAHLDELEEQGGVPPGASGPVRELWQQVRQRILAEGDEAAAAPAVNLTELRLDIARVQGAELERRERAGHVRSDLARELRHELDLQEVRLDRAT